MRKIVAFLFLAVGIFLFTACNNQSATISGCIANGAGAKITLLHQGAVSRFLLDTLCADAKGCFRYKISKSEGRFPMFVSVSIDSSASVTLLVKEGDRINITAEKGQHTYLVEGSEDSKLLQEVNSDLYESSAKFDSLMWLVKAEQDRVGNSIMPDKLNRELGEVYVKQHRSAVRFLIKNPASMASIAVLHERLPNGLPVFSRNEDAIYFKTVYDSLKVRYPSSEYVQALRDEYESRFRQMGLLSKMEGISELGFVDLDLPDETAKIVTLSSLKGRVILVYFWLSSDKEQLMYNNELKELYAKYHSRGLEIYQVSLDTDKAVWAKSVSDQALPWINVCDGFGLASSAASAYNIQKLPAAFLINKSGDLVGTSLSNEEMVKKVGELCR